MVIGALYPMNTDTIFLYDVFLSYTSSDRPIARKLAIKLRNHGVRVWFDEWAIKPGDDILYQIEEGLQRSQALMLCMTTRVFGSDWVGLERGTMMFRDPMNKMRRLIPVLLEDCNIPDTIRRYKYIDGRIIDSRIIRRIIDAIPNKPIMKNEKDYIDKEMEISVNEIRLCLDAVRNDDSIKDSDIDHKRFIFTEIDKLSKELSSSNTLANLAFMDIDGFTLINKKYGAKVGDEILVVLNKLIIECIGSNLYYIEKWGGDEFIFCIRGLYEGKANKILEIVKNKVVGYPWDTLTPELYLSVSIGFASFKRKHSEGTLDWIERTIIGSIFAKRAGGNTVKRGPVFAPNKIHRDPIKYLESTYGMS